MEAMKAAHSHGRTTVSRYMNVFWEAGKLLV